VNEPSGKWRRKKKDKIYMYVYKIQRENNSMEERQACLSSGGRDG